MRRVVAGGALLLLVAGCGQQRDASPPSARFTESGVEVSITVSDAEVQAAFRPLRPGFHVYSVDFAPGGVDGLGIPTKLAVRGGLSAVGRAVADRSVRMLELPSLGVRLPVYPDGPVAVSLRVRRTGPSAEVVTSYGACSASTCLPPVTGHVTRITLD